MRGGVSGECTPLVESDLDAIFDDSEAAIGAKAGYELLAMPYEGDGLGVGAGSSSSTDLPPTVPARPPAPVEAPEVVVLACDQYGRGFVVTE